MARTQANGKACLRPRGVRASLPAFFGDTTHAPSRRRPRRPGLRRRSRRRPGRAERRTDGGAGGQGLRGFRSGRRSFHRRGRGRCGGLVAAARHHPRRRRPAQGGAVDVQGAHQGRPDRRLERRGAAEPRLSGVSDRRPARRAGFRHQPLRLLQRRRARHHAQLHGQLDRHPQHRRGPRLYHPPERPAQAVRRQHGQRPARDAHRLDPAGRHRRGGDRADVRAPAAAGPRSNPGPLGQTAGDHPRRPAGGLAR